MIVSLPAIMERMAAEIRKLAEDIVVVMKQTKQKGSTPAEHGKVVATRRSHGMMQIKG